MATWQELKNKVGEITNVYCGTCEEKTTSHIHTFSFTIYPYGQIYLKCKDCRKKQKIM